MKETVRLSRRGVDVAAQVADEKRTPVEDADRAGWQGESPYRAR